MTHHELVTDTNGDPRCSCTWAPDPADCGPGITGQLRAVGHINRHANQLNANQGATDMNATPTPRDVATGHVDVAALRRQEAEIADKLAAAGEKPVRVVRDFAGHVYSNMTVTPLGRKVLAASSHVLAAEAPDAVKEEAHTLAMAALTVAANLELKPENLKELQDGAVVYYETKNAPAEEFSRNVMVRDRGAWWVAGSATPVCDIDLTPDYLATMAEGARLWLVRA